MTLAYIIQIAFTLLVVGVICYFGSKVLEKFIPGPSLIKLAIYVIVGILLLALGIQYLLGVTVWPPFGTHAVIQG